MIRLAILVEGETEEEFVRGVIAVHLSGIDIDARPIGLGGNVSVDRISDRMRRLIHNFDALTTLVDFYGFHGKKDHGPNDLEKEILDRVCRLIGWEPDCSRIFPYVQRHEFEGLLFSDVDAIADELDLPEASRLELLRIREQVDSPEDIDDDDAPSRRIERLADGYVKRLHGPSIASRTGLPAIREQCPRFNDWIGRIEALGRPARAP